MSDDDLALDRWASRRGEYLASTTILSRSEAEAVAYSERGFSDGGVAKQMDSTAGTVTQYLDRAVARFGPGVRLPCLEEDPPIEADLAPTSYRAMAGESRATREVWEDAIQRHPEYRPPAGSEAKKSASETAADGGREATDV